jgi:hypothetical protein
LCEAQIHFPVRDRLPYLGDDLAHHQGAAWHGQSELVARVAAILTDARVTILREENERLRAAVRGIFANPQGCPMCDAGVLRNPDKGHWDDCPYEIARKTIGEA